MAGHVIAALAHLLPALRVLGLRDHPVDGLRERLRPALERERDEVLAAGALRERPVDVAHDMVEVEALVDGPAEAVEAAVDAPAAAVRGVVDPLYVGDVVVGGDGGAHAGAHLVRRADGGEQRDVAAHAPLALLALAGVDAPRLELDRRFLAGLVGQEAVDRLLAPLGRLQRDEYAVALGEHVGLADAARGRRFQVGGDERPLLLDGPPGAHRRHAASADLGELAGGTAERRAGGARHQPQEHVGREALSLGNAQYLVGRVAVAAVLVEVARPRVRHLAEHRDHGSRRSVLELPRPRELSRDLAVEALDALRNCGDGGLAHAAAHGREERVEVFGGLQCDEEIVDCHGNQH